MRSPGSSRGVGPVPLRRQPEQLHELLGVFYRLAREVVVERDDHRLTFQSHLLYRLNPLLEFTGGIPVIVSGDIGLAPPVGRVATDPGMAAVAERVLDGHSSEGPLRVPVGEPGCHQTATSQDSRGRDSSRP